MSMSFSQAAEYLKSRNRFLLITHKNPDGDTVGSACALCHALRDMGKEAWVMTNPGFSGRYMPYLDSLCTEDYEPDCVVCVDIADAALIPSDSQKYADKVNFAVDHHESHRVYSDNILLDGKAAACGEVVYKLILEMGIEMSREIATALYVAVSTDTGCFLHSSTTGESHRIAAELIDLGVDINPIHREFFVVKSRSRMIIEAKLIENMKIFNGGKTAVMTLEKSLIEQVGATEDDLDNISGLARTIEGVELGILIREITEGKSKLSVRSSLGVNAAALCGAFGGGGHSCAAGCTINENVDRACELVCAEIDRMRIFED